MTLRRIAIVFVVAATPERASAAFASYSVMRTERVVMSTDAAGVLAYCMGSKDFSAAGTGITDGSVIERLDYSSTGDFAGGGGGPAGFYHDADGDGDIDLGDFADFQDCFDPSPPVPQVCLDVHDFDDADASDGDIDLDDYARFFECSHGPSATPDQACRVPAGRGSPPPSDGRMPGYKTSMIGRPIRFADCGPLRDEQVAAVWSINQ